MKNKVVRYTLLSTVAAMSAFTIGCGSNAMPDLSETQAQSAPVASLEFSAGADTVTNGGTVSLYILGGVQPYTFKATSGSVDSMTYVFTANTVGMVQITVTDANQTQKSVTISVLAPPPPPQETKPADTPPPPPPPPITVPAYLMHFPEANLHSTDARNITAYRWQNLGENYRFLRDPIAGSHPVYQCTQPTPQKTTTAVYSSTDVNCEGGSKVGIMGYLYDSNVANTAAVYRYSNLRGGIFGVVIDYIDSKTAIGQVGTGAQLGSYGQGPLLGYSPAQ